MIRKTLFLAAAATMSAQLSLLCAATFNVAGNWLADESGVRGIPNGALIMLIASTKDDSFDVPTSSSFLPTGSDDVILGTFTATDFDGMLNSGSFAFSIRASYRDASNGLEAFDGGDPLLIRWYPTLTEADLDALPEGELRYGEFRSDEILKGSDAHWIAPSDDGATIALSINADAFGDVSNPGGTIPLSDLTARNLFASGIIILASVDLAFGVDGLLGVSWALMEGTSGNRLQESVDLQYWSDVNYEQIEVANGRATVWVSPDPATAPAKFFRLVAE